WNNVIGLRPSQGRVPSWPTPDVWVSQLGTEGPMGRCVADVRALLRVQAGYDPRCPLSLADEAPPPQHAVADELRPQRSVAGEHPRIGWLGDLDGYLPVEPGVLAQCEQGLRRAESAGFVVEPVRANFDAARAWQTWLVWRRWLVAARLAPYLRDPAHRALVKPEALWEHDQAADLSAQAALQASEDRSALYRALAELLQRYDVLALPTTQCWPFDARERWPKAVAGRTMDTYHRWMEVVIYATLAGLPCINLPVGFGAQGLPMGMQWIGAQRGDWRLLDLAERYEAGCTDWLARRPDAAAAEPADPHFKPA
ncbi:MAG: amidase, partial [Betaproteobacteria bacterium]|nr:amidase [Betaproteobacteria bacterium]